ncbi:MAG: DUF885 domain-containing protein [Aquincola sp.]|nr:DUF885 domain-containing protein [Aquincola sp.]
MKRARSLLGGLVLLLLIVGGYAGYRIVWGTPFHVNQLANRQAVLLLMQKPELLTSIGLVDGTILDFHSGKLSDVTVARRDEDYADAERFIEEVKEFDRSKLGFQDQLTYDILLDQYSSWLRAKAYPWMTTQGPYPINQMTGLQTQLPRFLLSAHSITNAKTAESYVERVAALGQVIDQAIAEMRRQAKLGATPPVDVIDRALATVDAFLKPKPSEHPLRAEFEKKAKLVENLDAQALGMRVEAAIASSAYPAYQRLATALNELRSEAGRNPVVGMTRLPNGAAYYQHIIKEQTTTDMTAQEIHDYGLAEVARITVEMDAVLEVQGLRQGTVVERMRKLSEDPRHLFEDSDQGREAILTEYRRILDDIGTRVPRYFSVIPSQKLEVMRVPEFAEVGSAGAYFEPAALDGSRPGRFFANLRDVKETPKWTMKTLAVHEGIPGHFHQISVAQKLEGLPLIRQQPIYTAYLEGWALYAEHLAKEMGVYDNDPFGDLGRLQAEIFRAARLVVDTGLHAKGWTRQQAIDYMAGVTGIAVGDVATEVERYMVMPGQALAYKIGMKAMLDERAKAEKALGPKFDIKGFHDELLSHGAVPLNVLPKVIDRWIEQRKEGGSLTPITGAKR